jgi:hypothetical protein
MRVQNTSDDVGMPLDTAINLERIEICPLEIAERVV